MTSSNLQNVHSAILEVARSIESVAKTAVKGLGYKALLESSINEAVRQPMLDVGLTMVPVGCQLLDLSHWETRSGARMNRTAIAVTYRLSHAPSGEFVDVQVVGEAADSGDKSFAKAMTLAWKYAVRQIFMIPTGDDPDRTAHEAVGGEVGDGTKRGSSVVTPIQTPTAPVNGNGKVACDRPVIYEVKNLIESLDDPATALQSILAKRGIDCLDQLTDGDAQELRHKLGTLGASEFFGKKSLATETAKN